MRSGLQCLRIIVLLLISLWACSSRPTTDCIKLTPASCGCSDPQRFAEPPPPAQAPQAAASWTLTTSEQTVSGYAALRETVWTAARPPYGQYDYIALRRITQEAEEGEALKRPVFLFLPGPHQHGEIMLPDERYDLRLYLANRGIETWTLDYRTHFVTREQIYESAFMQSWTTEAFVEDVAVAAHFVRETSGAQMIFVGGFDRGATFAYLYAARHWRENRLGLIILDGYVLNPPDASLLYRQRTPTPEWFADDLEGRYMPYKRWMKILQDIIDDPSGPDFLPVSVFANRAEALAHFLYVNENFGGQGGLSNAKESYADVSILARILRHQDRYWPREQNHGGFEFERHLAKVEFDYKTALREMNVPILAFTGGNIGLEWEERVEYSARVTATKDVQYQVLLHWGHLDVLFGNYAAQEVFRPVSDWMARHTPALTPAVVSR